MSIRDALDYFLPFIEADFSAKESQERIDQRMRAAEALAPVAAPRAEGLPDPAKREFVVALLDELRDRPDDDMATLLDRLLTEWEMHLSWAAPRAEGLDVERLRREFGYLLDMYGARNDETGHWANCRDMLGLSRPSDERVPESEEPR